MTLVKNVDAANVDLEFTQGDTIDRTFDDLPIDLTDSDIKVHFRRIDGTLIKELTSVGSPSEITASGYSMTWLADGFSEKDNLLYDCQSTKAGIVKTFMHGWAIIRKEQTT